MPKITVEIELGEDGQVRVGIEPQEEGAAPGAPAEDKAYLQPVKSLEDALSTAKDLLSGSTGAQAQAADAEGDFQQGFAGARPMGAPGGAPAAPQGPQVRRMPGA